MNIDDFPVLPRRMPPQFTSSYFRIGYIIDYQLNLLSYLRKELDGLNVNNIGQLRQRLKIKRRITELNKVVAQLFRYHRVVKVKS
jgi:hypothetical protein